MTGRIIDGTAVATNVRSTLNKVVTRLKSHGIDPCLATVLVGENPASAVYVKNKQKAANEIGITTRDHKIGSTFKQNELLELVKLLNHDVEVHGILIQLPLPSHIDEFVVINMINPKKDVDGLTPYNLGMLLKGKGVLKPCTPLGIMELLDYYKIDVTGMDTVIVNRSNLVGKPLSFLLLERDATVTICHSLSKDLHNKLSTADLIITAVGNRERFTLTADMVKDGAVVIDVGITRYMGKLSGDVEFQSVKEKASWITPVPGGVGPMTVSMLLKNTLYVSSMTEKAIC